MIFHCIVLLLHGCGGRRSAGGPPLKCKERVIRLAMVSHTSTVADNVTLFNLRYPYPLSGPYQPLRSVAGGFGSSRANTLAQST